MTARSMRRNKRRRPEDIRNEHEATAAPAIEVRTDPSPSAKRMRFEDAVYRIGSPKPPLTTFIPAWKRIGLELKPSFSQVIAANRDLWEASTSSDESLAPFEPLLLTDPSPVYSTAPSSITSPEAGSSSEHDLITGVEEEEEVQEEEEVNRDGVDSITVVDESAPETSHTRRRSTRLSYVASASPNTLERKMDISRPIKVQKRMGAVNKTPSRSVLHKSPSASPSRRRSRRGMQTMSDATEFQEDTPLDTPKGEVTTSGTLPASQSRYRSQRGSYIETAPQDASEQEEKDTIANEGNTRVGEGDLVTRNRPSSRPQRRSSQRISYALVDGLESDEDPNDDDASIFEGSENDAESDDDQFPDDEALSSEGYESGSDEGYPRDQMSFADENDLDEADIVISPGAKLGKRTKPAKPATKQSDDKFIDLNLPPISNIGDLFVVLVDKALELGLENVLTNTMKAAFPLNVATIFSGTEAPLIALQQISNALEKRGMPPIQVNHLFSTEIDPVKQGYIERNFHPKLLFRDARDFIPRDSKTHKITATTAYGAVVEIPRVIDILIAGFVCKDLSSLNTNKKTLKDGGESSDTWKALYSFVKEFRPSVVLVENVKSNKTTWIEVTQLWEDIGYECSWHICDSKNYGLPQTRQRMYMVAINKELYGKGVKKAADDWQTTMMALARQCSSPFEAWLPEDLSRQHDYANLISETDWVLCKLRYERMRLVDRLGMKHPVSQYNENGSVCPPDFANRKFYLSQSSRVYDCIDVAQLLGALAGRDSLYKMAVWDVSQNADRFKTRLGILPAITPNGCDFVSNQQTALTGSQLLVLQGMPFDKLLLANETPKELQDLAGNAMSTPVIGASLLSALIHCSKAFHKKAGKGVSSCHTSLVQRAKLVTPKLMKHETLKSSGFIKLDMKKLVQDAKSSTQLCACEDLKDISKSPVQVCKECGHTACSDCSGNPLHVYDETIPRNTRCPPTDFIQNWRPQFPARLTFNNFPSLLEEQIVTGRDRTPDEHWRKFAQRVAEANLNSEHFSISKFVRLDNLWKVIYVSAKATLELHIEKEVEWRLFVRCPMALPGNNPIRKSLEQPVARGFVEDSLLEPKWELFLPEIQTYPLLISASSSEKTSSWRNRLGLPDFRNETVPNHLDVKSSKGQTAEHGLVGQYTLLPDCGTAMCSLYKKSSEPPTYLFLDCDPIGHGDLDSFVFSHDVRRVPYGSSRVSLARLDCSWRPWAIESNSESRVNATIPGSWVASDIHLNADVPDIHISLPPAGSIVSESSRGDCSQMVTMLNVQLQELLDTHEFSAYSWALEKAKLLPSFPQWQEFHETTCTTRNCECAPPFPRILWSVNEKFEASAHEDRKPAAQFERAVKTRPNVFVINASANSKGTEINVAANVSVLQHCARSRILGRFNSCSEMWRLVTDHVEPAFKKFPKLHLRSNSTDTPHRGPRRMKLELTETQKKSLTWMEKQEFGIPLTVEEIEEEIHAELGWRLEVRASTTITLRGGVLADLPSFGKTVTTIALIQNEIEKKDSSAILEENVKLSSGLPDLIDVAATLIVCPDHIAKQWAEEFERFLDEDQYEQYKVLLIMKHGDLERLTIKDMQHARLVIVSWKVLAHASYISDLAQFAALPEPAATKGRAYDAWLDYAVEVVPARLKELRDTGVAEFKKNTVDTLEMRLQEADFQAVVPIKIGHGSAYQTYDPANPTSYGKRTAKPIPRAKYNQKARTQPTASADWTLFPTPLLQLFRFNRVVVDEYHYLYAELDHYPTYAAVKKINAHKRWVLSGTPALNNFSDVNQIATLLGVKIGRDVWDSSNSTPLEKRLASDQTAVEKFMSRTQIMSYQWHEARHMKAQSFLDSFVRQNAPSLEHIDCTEVLRAVELGIAHKIVYLELSQHLTSLRMQIKKQKAAKKSKTKSKSASHRDTRFEMSLRNSETAEEALITSALEFIIEAGDSGLAALTEIRREQIEETKVEIFKLMKQANGVQAFLSTKSKTGEGIYSVLKELLNAKRGLGDGDSALAVSKLLREAKGRQTVSTVRTEAEATAHLKILSEEIFSASQELTTRMRSYRFIESIQRYLSTLSDGQANPEEIICSSPTCPKSTSPMVLIDNCGHMVCKVCLSKRGDKESCVHKGCDVPVQANNLITISDIGLRMNDMNEKSFGKKLDDVCKLINDIPDEDQCIVFVPNEAAVTTLEDVFVHHRISHHHKSALLAETIHDFQNNKNSKKMKKVLILTLGGVEASGVNLTNANHIIFLSPHLAESQYEYDSQMAQAVARSRRFGQEKKVFIYHFAALRTIDVDILEKRHRRVDGIQEMGSPIQLPGDILSQRFKTKLVRNARGHMALVPIAWLADDAKRAAMDVQENMSFTSLISFSDRYEYDDE